jgi:hypothetical protein
MKRAQEQFRPRARYISLDMSLPYKNQNAGIHCEADMHQVVRMTILSFQLLIRECSPQAGFRPTGLENTQSYYYQL